MTIEHFETEIQAWDPDGNDLPDQIVLHLDDCEACSALFNARFEQWQEPEPIVAPPDALSRVMPTTAPAAANNTWGYGGAVVLVAALFLGMVLLPIGVVGSLSFLGSEEEAAQPAPKTHLPNHHTAKQRKPAQDTAASAAELPPPPPPPVRRAPRKSGGGGGGATKRRAPSTSPGTIKITATGQTYLAAEIKCPGGTRKRAAFSGSTATIQGIPAGETCEVHFKGGLPVKFSGVKAGNAYDCTFQGSTVICK